MKIKTFTRRAFVAGTATTGLSLAATQKASAQRSRATIKQTLSSLQAQSGGVLVDYLGKDPGELDPTSPAALASTGFLAQHIYDPLVWFDFDLSIAPRLAESWQWVDPVTLVLALRQGVKFHNGRDVMVDDWVYSLQRYMDPELGAIGGQTLASLVDSVTAKSPTELQITTKEPNVVLLAHLAATGASVVCKEEVDAAGGVMKTTACGTGPFMLDEWTPNSHIAYVKNPSYWGGIPYLDGLRVQVIPEESSVVAALRTGQVTRGFITKGENFEILSGASNLVASSDTPSLGVTRLNLNRRHALQDKRLRQAVSAAIDRQMIINVVTRGRGVVAGPLSPALKDFVLPQDEVEQLEKRDLERAKALLQEAGYDGNDNQLTLILLSIAGIAGSLEVCQVVQENLKEAGIAVEIRHQEVGIWANARTESFDYDLSWNGLAGADPDLALWVQYHSTSDVAKWISLNDPELDSLLDEGRRETDLAARGEIYRDLQRHMIEDVSEIFLYSDSVLDVYQTTLQGYRTHPSAATVYYETAWLNA
jgi:peptide/nickel transport system substrate-binding protein